MDTRVERLQTGLFVALLLLINVVEDGLPKVANPQTMQVLLLPFTLLFLYLMYRFVSLGQTAEGSAFFERLGSLPVRLWLVYVLELCFVCLFLAEATHFASLGYRLLWLPTLIVFVGALAMIAYVARTPNRLTQGAVLSVFLGSYAAGHILAIFSFPLNYLRSDMLPVIFWANRALLSGGNPYQPFPIADRMYDFPYLPGMLLVFAPAEALHLDLRWASIAYLVVGMCLIFWATRPERRLHAAALIGLFILSPYLQYRHELYTQGHFLSLIVIFVLMQRRRYAWSAVAFGVSAVISQFSWVIFPFFLMNGLRRRGWKEVGRMTLLAAMAAGVLMAPFVAAGAGSIAHNAVGQWDNLDRAIARPINLSFWASYLVRPSHLKWIQLVILSGVFCFCWARGRCADLADTLRWMIVALTVFILFNVLLDGYFYLMLLVPMLVYTCVANGWWAEPPAEPQPNPI